MKKSRREDRHPRDDADEILPEYDFRGAALNPYAARIREGSTVVTLDPDVAGVFRTSEEVNGALRALADVIRQHEGRASTRPQRKKAP